MQDHAGEQWLQDIDKATLTPLVRQALRSDTVEVIDWEYRPLLGGAGDQGEGLQGLYRFAGNGHDNDETVNWSLVLKFSRTQAQGGDPQGGLRERLAYQSGVLENLPGGVVAPRCFGVVELPDELWLMWLEEITDLYETWPLERYGLAARHLGQFNGAYLTDEPLPTWPWLSKDWLRNWVAQAAPAIAQLPDAVQQPLVRRCYPPDVEAGLLRLWDEREHFLDALEHLPQTVCHLDAHRRNLFAHRAVNGQQQTAAIDWAFTGIGAVGEELAPLILASVAFETRLADLEALDKIVFNGYLDGLRDAGWHGDPKVVRYGYTASLAMRYGIGVVSLILPSILDESRHADAEQRLGLEVEARMDLFAALIRYELKLTDEARDLLDDMS